MLIHLTCYAQTGRRFHYKKDITFNLMAYNNCRATIYGERKFTTSHVIKSTFTIYLFTIVLFYVQPGPNRTTA